jgi:uncharacterized RDD family membrane protein YckC
LYAGFWRRFAALLIDSLLVGAVAFFIGVVIGIVVGASGREEIPSGWSALVDVATVIGWFLYFALMESSSQQATVGKIALGIQVTDLEGNRLTFGRALGRNLAKIISVLTLYIGFIIAAFTERRQALHDLIASALVVKRGEQPVSRTDPLEASA